MEERLSDMDAMGVDMQLLSPSPVQYHYWADADTAEAIVACHNERIARIVADHPDRFAGIGTLAMQHPGLALEQLDHAVRKLGLRGVQLSSLVEGVDIADPRFDTFWARAEELGALVYLHPMGTSLGPRLADAYLSNIVGQPVETAIALSKLILAGLFDRHERLKLCAAHGGGYLTLYSGRMDHGWAVRPESCGCRHRPSTYLKRIWYDTLVHDPAQLSHLIDTVGHDRLVIGSDYPYDMGHYDPHGLTRAIEGLSPRERERILGSNALAMLGMEEDRGGDGTGPR
ncbi:amidohydrolase family protein [Sphingobium sp. DC-2]|uniref:amidohydrolase family protein n=1 Tax=Sphingobium sp. DC-2 TaxID=1303256 RepID=UPI00068B6D8A|nr:amidohydrolase family protein [Sphingobium sp. DC-2]